MRSPYLVWSLSAVLVVSLGLNVLGFNANNKEKKYPLLSKRLFSQRVFLPNKNDLIINFTNLRAELRQYASSQEERIGIYFEYLPTGININVNGDQEFYRASLVKLPGVMRAMKLIEEGKLDASQKLLVKDYHINNFFPGETKLTPGQELTVDKLVELSLRESNNTAYEVLYERINGDILQKSKDDEQVIDDVYDFLDVNRKDDTNQTLYISPKGFASILKSLYFSSYLSQDHSSQLLEYLTNATFNDWLPQPIPQDKYPVAHKFGIFDLDEPKNYKVNSDCGIVYFPKRPYMLCVMVEHREGHKIGTHVIHISKVVFDYMNAK